MRNISGFLMVLDRLVANLLATYSNLSYVCELVCVLNLNFNLDAIHMDLILHIRPKYLLVV